MSGLFRKLRKWLLWLTVFAFVVLIAATLPLRWVDPPTTSFMLLDGWRHDRAIIQHRVDADRIPPHMRLAVIASEDQQFPHHFGFDLKQIREAVDTHAAGGRLRGASTISQQLARNLYLWPGRSWLRKGLEMVITVPLELFVPKHRILTIYLNVAEFDDGVFGVEAAANHYFDKPAAALTRSEAALLAALLPAPKRFNAADPSPELLERQRWILRQMGNLGAAWVPVSE